MPDPAYRSAKQLASLIRRKKIGCLELLNHYLERIDRYNTKINAVIFLDIQAARKRAKAADRALAKGEIWGPLHGVPMTVKDSYDLVGMPSTMVMVNGKPQPSTTQMFWAGYSCNFYLPATVAPIGFADDGLPVGIQIVGPQYGDYTCIHFARLLEREFQEFFAPPGFE